MTTTNALSVDLEEYFQVSNFEGVIARERWGEIPSRVADSTRRLLDLFDESTSRATFFVLGWVAERSPELVREIARRGHEIACHGHGHELVYELGPARFRADLRRARAAIEEATGTAIHGYRAPSFSITGESLWALRILAEEGFGFDSSIFPVRHPRYGLPGFVRHPVRLDLGGGASIREFPLTTLRVGPFVFPIAGGGYLRFLPEALFRLGFERCAKRGEPTVLYLHPWEVDPEQPRQDVGWKVRVNHYHNLGRVEARLRRLLGRLRFASVGSVLRTLEQAGRLPLHPLPEARPPAALAQPAAFGGHR